jgi:hypothetical protein
MLVHLQAHKKYEEYNYYRWGKYTINHILPPFENISSICYHWLCKYFFILQYNSFIPLLIGWLNLQFFQNILESIFQNMFLEGNIEIIAL